MPLLILLLLVCVVCMLIRDGHGFFADFFKIAILICTVILAFFVWWPARFR